MNDLIGVIKNDWEKIPQNYRYIILFGILLVFNAWLVDHWGNKIYQKIGWLNVDLLSYISGMILVITGFLIIIFKQIQVFTKILYLRHKYNLSTLGKEFELISFKGKWILFDKKAMKCYHIKPYETVLDLNLEGLEIYTDNDYKREIGLEIGLQSQKWLKIDKYTFSGTIDTTH